MLEGHYQKGIHSVDAYLKRMAIANPHVAIHFAAPDGTRLDFPCTVAVLPPRPREIKPHPRGIELGRLIQMLNETESHNLLKFLENEFSSVGRVTAQRVIDAAGRHLSTRSYPRHIAHAQATALHRAIQAIPVPAPRTDCIVPIGEAQLLKGLQAEVAADFYAVTTRPAATYRGNPFQVEVAIAYGHPGESTIEVDDSGFMQEHTVERGAEGEDLLGLREEPVHLLRYANRVPLLYQQSGCAITKAVIRTNWKTYGLRQPKGAVPVGPMAVVVHVASVWVPYTSESKEAIEPIPEIVREIVLGLQKCGRVLAHHLSRRAKLRTEYRRRSYIETYLPHIGGALQEILGLTDDEREQAMTRLDAVLHASRRELGGKT